MAPSLTYIPLLTLSVGGVYYNWPSMAHIVWLGIVNILNIGRNCVYWHFTDCCRVHTNVQQVQSDDTASYEGDEGDGDIASHHSR